MLPRVTRPRAHAFFRIGFVPQPPAPPLCESPSAGGGGGDRRVSWAAQDRGGAWPDVGRDTAAQHAPASAGAPAPSTEARPSLINPAALCPRTTRQTAPVSHDNRLQNAVSAGSGPKKAAAPKSPQRPPNNGTTMSLCFGPSAPEAMQSGGEIPPTLHAPFAIAAE